jgi:hypothetical protein
MTVSKFIIFDHQPICVNLDLVVVRHGGKPSRRSFAKPQVAAFLGKKNHNTTRSMGFEATPSVIMQSLPYHYTTQSMYPYLVSFLLILYLTEYKLFC